MITIQKLTNLPFPNPLTVTLTSLIPLLFIFYLKIFKHLIHKIIIN